MFGYATDETPERMPAPILYAHKILKRMADARKSGADALNSARMQRVSCPCATKMESPSATRACCPRSTMTPARPSDDIRAIVEPDIGMYCRRLGCLTRRVLGQPDGHVRDWRP